MRSIDTSWKLVRRWICRSLATSRSPSLNEKSWPSRSAADARRCSTPTSAAPPRCCCTSRSCAARLFASASERLRSVCFSFTLSRSLSLSAFSRATSAESVSSVFENTSFSICTSFASLSVRCGVDADDAANSCSSRATCCASFELSALVAASCDCSAATSSDDGAAGPVGEGGAREAAEERPEPMAEV